MRILTIFTAAVGLIGLNTAGAAEAATTIPFSGTITGIGAGKLDSTCAPATSRGTLDPANSSASSGLGSFSYGHDWCFYGPVGPINGTFDLFFKGGDMHGTLAGLASPSGTVGLTNLNLSYTILSGTGKFSGATGSFGGIATADVRGRRPTSPLFTLGFTGDIIAPAVPEPATWAMMIVGFGAIGSVMRRKRASSAPFFGVRAS